MDIKEYISSGVLESYLLGTASDQDRQAVECISSIYPEVKEELTRLQETIEEMSMSLAKKPPADLKSKILSKIEGVKQTIPERPVNPVQNVIVKEVGPTPLEKWLKIAALALLLIALGLCWMLYNYTNKTDLLEDKIQKLEQQNIELNKENAILIKKNEQRQDINNIIAQSDTRIIKLPGTKNNSKANVRVYWNQQQEKVLLKVDYLPVPAKDKQYQLWAIVDGTPVDMGVFEFENAKDEVQSIPVKISSSEAFAITLEKKGGSSSPTMENMIVFGKT